MPTDPGSEGHPCYLDVTIQGQAARGMPDSGSVISILSSSFYEKLRRLKRAGPLLPAPFARPMVDASGNHMEFEGVVEVDLAIKGGEDCVRATVAVRHQAGLDILLGTNVLRRNRELRMALLHLLGGRKPDTLVTLHQVSLPPRSTTHVVVFGTFSQPGRYYLHGQHCAVEDGLVDWEPYKTHLPLTIVCTNHSDRQVVFRPGQCLLKAELANALDPEEDDSQERLTAIISAVTVSTTPTEPRNRLQAILADFEPYLSTLPADTATTIRHLVAEYNECFAASEAELGQATDVEHDIDTGDTPPIKCKLRPIPLGLREPVRDMITDYLKRKVIRPSSSPWSSPIVLALKKDGSLRFCVDYRKLNNATKMDSYPLPNAEYLLHALQGKQYFSSLDLASGYWQIRLAEEAREKTAFSTPYGHFEWNVLPFGLSTSPACFERMLDSIFSDLIGHTLFIYLDDILIATETVEEHLQVLEEVLRRLRQANLKLKGRKCHFLKREIDFLGHRIVEGGIHTDAEKVEKIRNYPVPTNAQELRVFHGMASYYRKFIRNFSVVASPLRALLRKDTPFTWGKPEQESFEALKNSLLVAPVLIQPDIQSAIDGNRPFIIYTDAAHAGLGAVLMQRGPDEQLHPVAFASRGCTKAERNYGITDLEGLGLLFAVKKFRPFIYNTHTIVRTDHQPLIGLLTHNQPSARLMRWALELQDFPKLTLEYVPGTRNGGADGLSRMPGQQHDDPDDQDAVRGVVMAIASEADPMQPLNEDPTFAKIIRQLRKGPVEGYAMSNDRLFRVSKTGQLRMAVPPSLRKQLFNDHHSGTLGAHSSAPKLLQHLSQSYYWPRMAKDLVTWSKACLTCLVHNTKPAERPPLRQIEAKGPYDICNADLMDMGSSASGSRYALVIVDHFTKWGVAYPINSRTLKPFVERSWSVTFSPRGVI
ncbi:gagpol and env protein precursor [Aphelenchoides avenae]|nr:gagpol and env protein precursor [Aphelenchus avenae]